MTGALTSSGISPAQYLIAMEYLKMLREVASAEEGQKTVFMPFESANVLGAVGGIKGDARHDGGHGTARMSGPVQRSGPIEWVASEDVPVDEILPGLRVRRLWGERGSPRALLVDIAPGVHWPGVEVHDTGPEEVYVVQGVFQDGERSYPAGTFIHNPTDSQHVPGSDTGCTIFVFYPEG